MYCTMLITTRGPNYITKSRSRTMQVEGEDVKRAIYIKLK